MKDVSTLKDLMILQLQSIFEAESNWSRSVQEMVPAVSHRELKSLFEKSSRAAADHAAMIRQMLSNLDASTLSRKNIVAADMARELREVQETAADTEVMDAGMILTHQCMNHYLIAKYGTLSSYARLLLYEDIAAALHRIMEEEKSQDEDLTRLAESKVNISAKAALIH